MTHSDSRANRDLSDYLNLALRLANLFPPCWTSRRARSALTWLPATVLAASVLVACWGIPGCSSETESDADKMSGPMARRNTGKMEPETK